jgi:hypothetical protein
MAYKYTNKKGTDYYLHTTKVQLRGGNRTQVIYYFSRKVGDNALDEVPEGFEVVENERTGLPVLRRTS